MGKRMAAQFIASFPYYERGVAQSLYERQLRPLARRRREKALLTVLAFVLLAVAGLRVFQRVILDDTAPYVCGGSICFLALAVLIAGRRARKAERRIIADLGNLYRNCSQMVPPTRLDGELAGGRYGQKVFWQIIACLRMADRSVPDNHEIQVLIGRA